MKLLFITNHFLDANGGASFASRAYANAFAELAEECMILYPDRGKDVKEYLHTKYVLRGITNQKNELEKLIDIYTGRIHRFSKNDVTHIQDFTPDVVVFDNSRCSAGILKSIQKLGIRIITIHHNYEMEYYRGTPPKLLWRIPFMHYMRKAEKEAVLLSDLNLTLTNEDTHLFKNHYAKNKNINIAILGCFESKEKALSIHNNGPRNSKLRFVITGSLVSMQTEISLIPFLKEIYPKLLELYPDSELIIAGQDPSENIQSICNDFSAIKLVPNPIDMHEIIEKADIYICPMNVGGGLKLRVMDGLREGLPVITHKISARGYDPFVENNCMFVYQDKDTFITEIKKLVKMLNNNELDPQKIKDIYHNNFSYTSGVKRLKNILQNRFVSK